MIGLQAVTESVLMVLLRQNNTEVFMDILEPLKSLAISHINKVLEVDSCLSALVKPVFNREGGRFFTVPPGEVSVDKIVDFSWGFGKGRDTSVGGRLLGSLQEKSGRVLIIDDVMAGPEEMAGSAFGLLVGDKVCHVLSAEGLDENIIDKYVKMAGVSWHFLAVIIEGSSIDAVHEFLGSRKIIDPLVVVEVVVGAYDGEGFIHWYPNA